MAQFSQKATVQELCRWAEVPRSSFHYKSHPGPRGMKPSTHTLTGSGLVENHLVVEQIRAILQMDYCVYGYGVMTRELKSMTYLINRKKVYRLMTESHLLCGRRIKAQGKRQWVSQRRIKASRPLEYLCLDIKYVWVHGEGRHYYQLSVIDVFSRKILCWIFQRNIRQQDVVSLMRGLDLRFGLKGVVIRNDNGSQFIAYSVREALKQMEAHQEFTHVATPEENAYIEAFHSIQQRELMDRFTFSSFYDAKEHIQKYMYWYNHVRRHGGIGWITPVQKWEQGFTWLTVRPPSAPAAADLSRPDQDYALWAASASYSLDKADEPGYLCLNGYQEKDHLVANHLEKNVQLIGG
jgi:transposase InsO family protein